MFGEELSGNIWLWLPCPAAGTLAAIAAANVAGTRGHRNTLVAMQPFPAHKNSSDGNKAADMDIYL